MKMAFPARLVATVALTLSLTVAVLAPSKADVYRIVQVSGSLQSGNAFGGTITLDIPAKGDAYMKSYNIVVSGPQGATLAFPKDAQYVPGNQCQVNPNCLLYVFAFNADSDNSIPDLELLIPTTNGPNLNNFNGGAIIPAVQYPAPICCETLTETSGYFYAYNVFSDVVTGGTLTVRGDCGNAPRLPDCPPVIVMGKNGIDVTDKEQPTRVAIGQRISLTLNPPPSNVSSYQWNIQGTTVGNYLAPNHCATKDCGPCSPCTTTPTLNAQSLDFYWTTYANYPLAVNLNYTTTDGTQHQTSALFSVVGPTAPPSVAPVTVAFGSPEITYIGPLLREHLYLIFGGNFTAGITATNNAGNLPDYPEGRFFWVQIENNHTIDHSGQNPYGRCFKTGLDNSYPYGYRSEYLGYPYRKAYQLGLTGTLYDSPAVQLLERFVNEGDFVIRTKRHSGVPARGVGMIHEAPDSMIWGRHESQTLRTDGPAMGAYQPADSRQGVRPRAHGQG